MRSQHNSGRKFLLPLLGLALLSGGAQAASARCFMHGIIVPPGTQKTQLSDMIRLHFDADDKKKCEMMFTSYCQIQVIEKGFVTDRLKGVFRPESKGEEKAEESRYKFDPKCKLLPETEEEEKK